jgi:hypothetical protein
MSRLNRWSLLGVQLRVDDLNLVDQVRASVGTMTGTEVFNYEH